MFDVAVEYNYLMERHEIVPIATTQFKAQMGADAEAAIKKADELIKEAVRIVTDDNVTAGILYELCPYETLTQKYPATDKGRLVLSSCDNLKDYRW